MLVIVFCTHYYIQHRLLQPVPVSLCTGTGTSVGEARSWSTPTPTPYNTAAYLEHLWCHTIGNGKWCGIQCTNCTWLPTIKAKIGGHQCVAEIPSWIVDHFFPPKTIEQRVGVRPFDQRVVFQWTIVTVIWPNRTCSTIDESGDVPSKQRIGVGDDKTN